MFAALTKEEVAGREVVVPRRKKGEPWNELFLQILLRNVRKEKMIIMF